MILSFHLDGEPGEINTRYGMYEEEEDGTRSALPRKRRNRPTPMRFDPSRAADAVCAAVDDRK